MFSHIKNSRKSFIFFKLNDNHDKKLNDLNTIESKLNYKIYTHFNEFFGDMKKMVKYCGENMLKNNSI